MLSRRHLLGLLTATGIGSPILHRALAQLAADQSEISEEMIRQAQWISGIQLTDEQQAALVRAVNGNFQQLAALRKIEVDFGIPPAVQFQALAGPVGKPVSLSRAVEPSETAALPRPESNDDLSFLPLAELAQLVRTRQIRSQELTQHYLDRLKKYDPLLRCVVNYTEELAWRQAEQADRELAAGIYRGPLHGIPWGAKDLMAVAGYPTSWGIPGFRQRQIPETATVVERLNEAGAVLVAKLSLGAIAMGDRWFGQMTRNPWNPKNGSSGSSAGSAAATAAGCVGFSLGTETLGSIVSPSTRCGTTGLRPTFGRVSRHGCMPLAWSMDKVGPICRSVEDCALVFAAIHGADGRDPTATSRPFDWPTPIDLRRLRVGVLKRGEDTPTREDEAILRDLGCQLVEVELPQGYPLRAMTQAIDIEGAEIFQKLLWDGQTEGWNDWPDIFRAAHFVSAVDYLKLMRVRRKLMLEMEQLMQTVDVLFNCNDLIHTNLTGHPAVVLPWEIAERDGVRRPRPATFAGQLNDESRLLAVAHAFQKRVTGHLQRPPLDAGLEQLAAGTLDDPPAGDGTANRAPNDPGKNEKGGGK